MGDETGFNINNWLNNFQKGVDSYAFSGSSITPQNMNVLDAKAIDGLTAAFNQGTPGLGGSTAIPSAGYNPQSWSDMNMTDKLGSGLSALQTLGSLYLGSQQLKLGRKSLAEQIRSFNANYDAQRQLANATMFDKQQRMNRELGGSYNQASDRAQQYVDTRGIKELSNLGG